MNDLGILTVIKTAGYIPYALWPDGNDNLKKRKKTVKNN